MANIKYGTALAAFAFVLAGAVAVAAPASADDPCDSNELGKTANGAVCVADDAGQTTWMPDGGAAKVIADLQAQGYTVTIDAVGDNPLSTCIVTQVHNAQTTTQRYGSGGTTPGGTGSLGNHHTSTITVTKSIDVSLDCTGHN